MGEYKERSLNIEKFVEKENDDLIICRCEEITQGEIREAIYLGMWTMTEIKRFIRPGMGLCQGQTCSKHVKKIIADELSIKIADLAEVTARAPMRPISMEVYGNEVTQNE